MPATDWEMTLVLRCDCRVGELPSVVILCLSEGGSGVEGPKDDRMMVDDRGVPLGVADLRLFFFRFFIDFTACSEGSRVSKA